jgi:integrase
MKPAVMFNAKTPDTIAPGPVRIETRDQLVDGLRLITQPNGKRSWAIRFTHGKKKWKHTLGKWPLMTVADARTAAKAVHEQLQAGVNPCRLPVITDADSVPVTDTSVDGMIALYERLHIKPLLRPATQRIIRRELQRASEVWGSRDIASITKEDVRALCNAAIKRGVFAKNQTIKVFQAWFSWLAEDQAVIPFSPATGMRKAENTTHDRVLGDGEIRILWKRATEIDTRYGAAIKMLLLTGMRKSEIGDLEWSEVHDDAIRIPKARTKTKIDLCVHLTPLMKSVFSQLPRKGRFVFGQGKRGDCPLRSFSWIRKLLGENLLNERWRTHDLRHTVRTNLSRLRIPENVAEACIGHTKKGLKKVYDHHDFQIEKAEAFEKWNAFVEQLVSERQPQKRFPVVKQELEHAGA